ncbi:MAG: hypothetical protein WEF86_05750 [Gemmatimonadota bacterium]
MSQRWSARPQWLREQPPEWPGGDPLDRSGRWRREPDAFELSMSRELYPGATVMEDLAETDEEIDCSRILARYTVLRVLVLSGAGWLTGPRLRIERRVALEHLALLPQHDWERHALERLCHLCRETPADTIVTAAAVAAEAAAKRGHVMGAFALYRAAYELARRRAWWAAGAAIARGVSRLARLEEARYSERLWARRARVLDRRVARETTRRREADGDGRRL